MSAVQSFFSSYTVSGSSSVTPWIVMGAS
jgi:hypothetical protein